MRNIPNPSNEAVELRKQAETQYSQRSNKAALPQTKVEIQRLVHELQVHQIEMEMQNEELLRARAEVEAGLEHYTDLYDFAPVGYFTLARDGAIRQVNLNGARMLGVARGKLVGKCFGLFIAGSDQPAFNAFLEQVFAETHNPEPVQKTCEVVLHREDTSQRVVHIEAVVAQDAQTCRAMVLDITERKHLEDKLCQNLERAERSRRALLSTLEDRKQGEMEIIKLNSELEQRVRERTTLLESANKELEAFSYSVSHDLRAPLRGIDGWSHILLEENYEQLNEQGRESLNFILSETKRMGLLIENLIQLSRISRTEMRRDRVDISALAQNIVVRLQKDQPRPSAEVIIQPGLTTHGDGALLDMVLTNLLDNAWKYTGARPNARIELGQSEVKGQPAFFVRDNGAGFDMAYAQKLFGVFQRMHRATEFPGTGIGLAIVQRIIHRHGGEVWAEARVNQGATFYFTLPKYEEKKI